MNYYIAIIKLLGSEYYQIRCIPDPEEELTRYKKMEDFVCFDAKTGEIQEPIVEFTDENPQALVRTMIKFSNNTDEFGSAFMHILHGLAFSCESKDTYSCSFILPEGIIKLLSTYEGFWDEFDFIKGGNIEYGKFFKKFHDITGYMNPDYNC